MGLQPFCFWGWVAEARDPNVGRCPTRRSAALPGLSRLPDWLMRFSTVFCIRDSEDGGEKRDRANS